MITLSEIEYETEDQTDTLKRIRELITLSNRIESDEWQLDDKEVAYGSIKQNGFVIKPVHPMFVTSVPSIIHAHGKPGINNSIIVKFKLSIPGLLVLTFMIATIFHLFLNFEELQSTEALFLVFLIVITITRTFRGLKRTENLMTRIIERNS